MESLLERTRGAHESIERFEQAIVDRLAENPRTLRDRLANEHQVADLLGRIRQSSQYLLGAYADADGAHAKEIEALSGPDPFAEFYKQLKDVKDFHRKYPNETAEDLEQQLRKRSRDEFEESEVDRLFSGEEGNGRFFDLYTLHEEYVNLKGVKPTPYLRYLDIYDDFTIVPRQNKTDSYFKYVGALKDYLASFFKRVKPLENHEKVLAKISDDFSSEWQEGSLPAWKDDPTAPAASGEGIYCDACEKYYSKQTVYDAHLNSKKHKKAVEARGDGNVAGDAAKTPSKPRDTKQRAIAEREYIVAKLSEILAKQRQDTKTNVERKQSLTDAERRAELDAADEGAAEGAEDKDDDSDDEERIYNPLKLPLGWDGKPIPYWLYKLHGLGVEYSCEICGGHVYRGRKEYERHFMESRHVYGLRCLGIPASHLFKEITSIADATALWAKLRTERRDVDMKKDAAVEMEDDEGNVMSEKVYNDLKNQGLL
ncbi:Pre-mRNA-splicing factor sap61 [Saitoella coloradoensis]